MGNSPIVNRINSLFAEKGIDKKRFYEDCGITSASYSLWNTGKTNPRIKNLETIASYLHVPVAYLLEGKEHKENPPPITGRGVLLTYMDFSCRSSLPASRYKLFSQG